MRYTTSLGYCSIDRLEQPGQHARAHALLAMVQVVVDAECLPMQPPSATAQTLHHGPLLEPYQAEAALLKPSLILSYHGGLPEALSFLGAKELRSSLSCSKMATVQISKKRKVGVHCAA